MVLHEISGTALDQPASACVPRSEVGTEATADNLLVGSNPPTKMPKGVSGLKRLLSKEWDLPTDDEVRDFVLQTGGGNISILVKYPMSGGPANAPVRPGPQGRQPPSV